MGFQSCRVFSGSYEGRAQNGTSGVLSGESNVDSHGRSGGWGSSFLLWGEPGVRRVGVWGLLVGLIISEAGKVVPKVGRAEYFRVNRTSIRTDGRAAGDHAACYGVNLAFAAAEVWFV
jgi:hypothetical protein